MTHKHRLHGLFGVDLRSLALFRVLLASLLICDLADRAEDMRAFYTDGGVLPRAALVEKFSNVWHVSAHLMSGQWQVQGVLFVLAALAAFAMLVGWRTRLMTALSWGFLISLHARNPMVLQAGDVLLRLIMFWAMFLPLGARYSVDAGLGMDERKVDNRHLSVGGAALLIQVAFVYWFTVPLKSGHEWWPDGTAVYYALHIDILATRAGVWLRQYGELLRLFTFGSMAAELLLPAFLFLPFFSQRLRLVGILGLAGMHASFGLFMELGIFPWIDLVSLVPFIPAVVWDWCGAKLRTAERTGLTLRVAPGLPDRVARVARSMALLKETTVQVQSSVAPSPMMPLGRVVVSAVAGEGWQGGSPAEAHAVEAHAAPTWSLLTHDGKELSGDAAWLEAARLSPLGGWIAAAAMRVALRVAALPIWPRAACARLANRALIPGPIRLHPHPLTQLAAAVFLGLAFWWNLTTVPDGARPIPSSLAWLAQLSRIDQQWGMFAPFPLKDDGWYVTDGKLRDKTPVDVTALEIQPASFDKPPLVSATFANQRWRKYMMNLWSAGNKPHRLYYGRYLCRTWNAQHPADKQLDEFQIYYMREDTLPDYQPSKVEKVSIWHHFCFK